MKSPFICIDGTDGSGKGTHTAWLHRQLEQRSIDVELLDFPRYDEASSYFVRRYLNGEYGTLEDIGPKTASLFYALDRLDARKGMEEAMRRSAVLLTNRYVTSNMGHQASKIADASERNAFLDWVESFEYGELALPRPTLQIILCMPVSIAQRFVDQKGARSYTNKTRDLHEADQEHLRLAEQAYREVARRDETYHLIECAPNGAVRSLASIQHDIWQIVVPHLVDYGVLRASERASVGSVA